MHNGILGVIGFKVFECWRWVEGGIFVNDPGFRYRLNPGHQTDARGFFVENYDHHSRLAVPPDFFPPLHFPVDLSHFGQALTHLL